MFVQTTEYNRNDLQIIIIFAILQSQKSLTAVINGQIKTTTKKKQKCCIEHLIVLYDILRNILAENEKG